MLGEITFLLGDVLQNLTFSNLGLGIPRAVFTIRKDTARIPYWCPK